MRALYRVIITGCLLGASWATAFAHPQKTAQPFRITVSAWPHRVHVGQRVQVTVRANQPWIPGSRVTVVLSATNHNITIGAPWDGRCSCFRVWIYLIPRVHPPEPARIVAHALAGGHWYQATTTFEIYGLLPNGRPEPIPPAVNTTLPIHAWVYPDPSTFDDYPTLWAETVPGATCSAKVTYSNGKVPAMFSGSLVETDGNGLTGWTWYVDKTALPTGLGIVTCDRDNRHGTARVVFHVHL
jgi:hypothetical protein